MTEPATGTPASADDNAGQTTGKNPAEVMLDALAKHGLAASDYDLLVGFIDDPAKLDEMAGKLAAMIAAADENAPRRPQPNKAQGMNSGYYPTAPHPLRQAIETKLRGLAY
jgi:hypothetical protein